MKTGFNKVWGVGGRWQQVKKQRKLRASETLGRKEPRGTL